MGDDGMNAASTGSPGAIRVRQTLGVPDGPAVLILQEPSRPGALRCDGQLMRVQRPPACSVIDDRPGDLRAGDHFVDPPTGLRVLCTRAGDGLITFMRRPLERHVAARV